MITPSELDRLDTINLLAKTTYELAKALNVVPSLTIQDVEIHAGEGGTGISIH